MAESEQLNEKSKILLKSLVEQYIADGQPIGSKTLADAAAVQVSPATVRNVMADLEDLGFVRSPHTSAGRVPTALGYRFFVDSLIQVGQIDTFDLSDLNRGLDPDMSSKELVESASGILSEFTRMAGLVTIPKRDQVTLRHLDFLSLEGNRVLVILVLDDHEVQNRVIYTKQAYSEVQLREASNFLNAQFAGEALGRIRERLLSSMKADRESMNSLMQTTLEVVDQAFETESTNDFVVKGQENLLETNQALEDIRQLFEAISMKGDILHLLDRCMESEGVQLFIGNESGYEVLDECSVVTAPYQVEGQLVGVLGVIGPTRMAYDRVIPIVDATARLLSAALDTHRR
ncbi:MAG: heat-inducible transcription repressor HrcA [Pseudomonadales bacterium]|nr:heat-inducible transcription repressor HrcA [Pseudomonadales bacterium]MBO6564049.1 heat-inducible transcription repressor HrcA [Pseudomonadales bacterium]MBO6597446.1 heat-inducible transcription repressor HrcA [Pseudomonadales bacterium]MBO6658076.1 heat-inducible transcription repressor HrcA [Pseudomonadales bacterium]MBO6703059.1 heat-inducible transcription repressor HrcA [Pseudomonadales bacterium]